MKSGTETLSSESPLLNAVRPSVSNDSVVRQEIGRGMLSTVHLSRWYILYCLVIMGLSLWVSAHMFFLPAGAQIAVYMIVVDGLLTLCICLETGVDMVLYGKEFWTSSLHLFDLFVSILCLVGFLLILADLHGISAILDEALGASLLIIRYATQVFRIVRYMGATYSASCQRAAVEQEGAIRFPENVHSPVSEVRKRTQEKRMTVDGDSVFVRAAASHVSSVLLPPSDLEAGSLKGR